MGRCSKMCFSSRADVDKSWANREKNRRVNRETNREKHREINHETRRQIDRETPLEIQRGSRQLSYVFNPPYQSQTGLIFVHLCKNICA